MEVVSRSVSFNTFPIVLFFSLLLATASGLRPCHFAYHSKSTNENNQMYIEVEEIGMELYPTGSSLPDCWHACGACTRCRRVMVSFRKCSVESCPIIYRCMCKGKYYHVPSN